MPEPDIDDLAMIQEKLARRVDSKSPLASFPELLGGLDAAYSGENGVGVAAVVGTRTGELVETASARLSGLLDYRPGFFGFREAPLLVRAASKLKSVPDAFIVEGHGVAHPRCFGLACHVGLALSKPTVGVARRLLYGREDGSTIVDTDGVPIGQTVHVEGRRLPLFVSVGDKLDIASAVRVVRMSLEHSPGYPLPLRMAHQESVKLRDRYFTG